MIQVEGDVLENIRLDDGVIGFDVGQSYKRAGAADDPLVRHHIGSRKNPSSRSVFNTFGIGLKRLGHAPFAA